MKKTSYILGLLCLLLLSCKSTNPINGFGEEDKVCRKYDAINDITYVTDLSDFKEYLVKGKWRKNELRTEYYISHCPIVENQLGTILELWIRGNDKFEWKNKSDEEILIKNFNEYSAFWKKKNIKHTIVKSDKKASYYIYEIIEFDRRRIELMGIKNKKYYRITIFNFDPNRYTSIEDFLIGIFAIN